MKQPEPGEVCPYCGAPAFVRTDPQQRQWRFCRHCYSFRSPGAEAWSAAPFADRCRYAGEPLLTLEGLTKEEWEIVAKSQS